MAPRKKAAGATKKKSQRKKKPATVNTSLHESVCQQANNTEVQAQVTQQLTPTLHGTTTPTHNQSTPRPMQSGHEDRLARLESLVETLANDRVLASQGTTQTAYARAKTRHTSAASTGRPASDERYGQMHTDYSYKPSRYPRRTQRVPATRGFTGRSRPEESTSNSSDSDRSLTPRRLLQRPEVSRQIEQEMAAQYPGVGNPGGRPSQQRTYICARPYDMLPPDMRKQAKPRRKSLTIAEYSCGFIRMVMPLVQDNPVAFDMLNHFTQVCEDAASIDFSSAREWSMVCQDLIREGQATWQSSSLFAAERMRISWLRGKANGSHEIIPCHAYNQDQCDLETGHHVEGGMAVHVCAVCFYGQGRRCAHAAKECNKKRKLDNRPDQVLQDKQEVANKTAPNTGFYRNSASRDAWTRSALTDAPTVAKN